MADPGLFELSSHPGVIRRQRFNHPERLGGPPCSAQLGQRQRQKLAALVVRDEVTLEKQHVAGRRVRTAVGGKRSQPRMEAEEGIIEACLHAAGCQLLTEVLIAGLGYLEVREGATHSLGEHPGQRRQAQSRRG
ncbi:MAG: hypothetical protein CVT62_08500 [Actinobacteria bacterium HGW-Actinobacteria-2]|nr:MAG: hypothetical protein CVT62_08500 [Actinobacteria bacterium HGW-Actinobacteria-2]